MSNRRKPRTEKPTRAEIIAAADAIDGRYREQAQRQIEIVNRLSARVRELEAENTELREALEACT